MADPNLYGMRHTVLIGSGGSGRGVQSHPSLAFGGGCPGDSSHRAFQCKGGYWRWGYWVCGFPK